MTTDAITTPSPTETAPAPVTIDREARKRVVLKHPLALRWMHWINFPVLAIMIWSGVLILWAYDSYPTEKYRLRVPNRVSVYQWGVAPVYAEKDDENYPVPAAKRYDIPLGFRLAEGMAWHYAFAWLFTLNGVAYVLFLVFSGQWKHIVPRANSLSEAFKVVLHDVGLYRKPLPPGKYNHAQRIAYSGVIVLGALMVLTGLAIYKPAQLTWLTLLFGGYQGARIVHFVITFLFVGFFFVHVAQVMRAGWNNFRGMITGYEVEKESAGSEAASLEQARTDARKEEGFQQQS